MIPGGNLLEAALSALGTQTVSYYKFTGRTVNAIGEDVDSFDLPVDVTGSLQPVPKTLYTQYGLDLTKTYVTFYAPVNSVAVDRDVGGDEFEFSSDRYKCESLTDWFAVDGWVAIKAVRINVG